MNVEHNKDIESCNNNHQKQEVVEEELQGLVINNSQQTTTTIPLEITSRQSFDSSTDSVIDIKSSSPLPSKRLFFDISNRATRSSSCIQKKRRIKSIVAIGIAIVIIVLSVALITRRIFNSSQSASFDWTEDSSSKDDNKDSNMTPSSNNNNENNNTKDTAPCNDNIGECDKPYKDPNNHHILNEPNPPILPSSMIVFHPPTCYAESLDIMNKVKEYSDPIVTWDDNVSNTNTNNGNNDTNSNNNINQPNNNKDEERPENYPKYTYTANKHFTTQRTALLFAPGSYPNVDFEVGYYTSVLGLGKQPTDTQFTGNKGPYVEATDKYTNRPPFGSGLDTFWRSIEK